MSLLWAIFVGSTAAALALLLLAATIARAARAQQRRFDQAVAEAQATPAEVRREATTGQVIQIDLERAKRRRGA